MHHGNAASRSVLLVAVARPTVWRNGRCTVKERGTYSVSKFPLAILTPVATKIDLTILVVALLQNHVLEVFWRISTHQSYSYNSPSNILWIIANFQSFFHKYHRSRRHFSNPDGRCTVKERGTYSVSKFPLIPSCLSWGQSSSFV